MLDKGIPLWKAMNFPRSGGRSQAGKRRMREIRPSGDRRKGPLLNSGAALRRQPRLCLWMCSRRLKGGGDAFALLHLGLTSRFRGRRDFLLGLSCFNLLVVLIHSVIPFLKFCVGQKVYVGFCHHAASLVHRVNNSWIYSRIASSLQ